MSLGGFQHFRGFLIRTFWSVINNARLYGALKGRPGYRSATALLSKLSMASGNDGEMAVVIK